MSFRRLKIVSGPEERGSWGRALAAVREQLHDPDGTLFLPSVEAQLARDTVTVPWVGFVHRVDLEEITTGRLADAWRESVPHCRGLWVFSDYHRNALRAAGVTVPIGRLRRPPPPARRGFDAAGYLAEARPTVYLLDEGASERGGFHELPSRTHRKVLLRLRGDEPTVDQEVPNDALDDRLATGIVFLTLREAEVSEALVACILRAVPVLVNPVGSVPEYLGRDYPLYYTSLQEAAEKLDDRELLVRTHERLAAAAIRSRLTDASFVADLGRTAVYRALPVPESQRDTFRERDVTLVLCTYRRMDALRASLERIRAQDFDGTFELFIWNNNPAQAHVVDATVSEFRDTLDVKVMHSSENFFCAIRTAMPSFMRSPLLMVIDDDVMPEPGYLRTFVRKWREYGPNVVCCARGHTFDPHTLDEDRPDRVWSQDINLRFHDERAEDRDVHFMHADNCLLSRDILVRALQVPMPRHDFVLVDDYWLSFVISHHLRIPIRKIRADHLFTFTPSSEDPTVAMYHNPLVRQTRVDFYVYHMREGWPASVLGPEAAGPKARPDR